MHSSHRHHRRSVFYRIRHSFDRFLERVLKPGSTSAQEHGRDPQPPGMDEQPFPPGPDRPAPGYTPADTDHPYRRKSRKRNNSLKAYFRRRLEKFADRMEARRERRNKQKFMRAIHKRHRKEEKKRRENIFVTFYKKFFERKSHEYGYYTSEGTDKEKQELKRQRKRLAFFSINSFILFLLTYLIAYLTYQLAVMFTASRYGINSILLYYEVFFPIGNYSDRWNSFNIIIITFAGPLISVIMGTIYLLVFVRRETISGLRKLFFFWLGFHSVNFFLGGFVAGVVTYQGFGYVIAWMFLPTVIKFGLSIVCLFVIGLIGFLYAPFFLEFAGSFFWTKKRNKIIFLLFTAFLPWAVGIFSLFWLKFPRVIPQHENIVVYDTVIYFSMFFAIAGLFVNFRAEPFMEKGTKKEGRRINWIYLVVLAGLLVLFRWGLNSGFYYLAP